MPRVAWCALFILGACAQISASPSGKPPILAVNATSHYDAGFQIGTAMKDMIVERFAQDHNFQTRLLPFAASEQGAPVVEGFLSRAKASFPQYVEELQGTADGAGLSFESVFVMNLREEINALLDKPFKEPLSCSDYSVLMLDSSPPVALVSHNEDGSDISNNHTYMLEVVIGQGHTFTAYSYAGEIPSGAFGWNTFGVGFTLNYLQAPTLLGGIGRNFISRWLLDASSLEEAVGRASSYQPQATGHNFQIFSIGTSSSPPAIVNIELAPTGAHVMPLRSNATLFHANCYMFLNPTPRGAVPSYTGEQPWKCIDNEIDSVGRMARASELPVPHDVAGVVAVLGDTENKDYPIYAEPGVPNADGRATLNSVVIDLVQGTASVLYGNPKLLQVYHKFDIGK